MIRNLLVAFAIFFAIPSLAATTWTADTSQDTGFVRVAKAVYTTGTETAPADGDATAGLALIGIEGGAVYIEATVNMTAGSKFTAYVYNPISTKWLPMPGMDITLPGAVQRHAISFEVWGDWSRIAWVPTGTGQASTLYIEGRRLTLPALYAQGLLDEGPGTLRN